MSNPIHTIDAVNSGFSRKDKIFMGLGASVANAAGAGAGASVSTNVSGLSGLPSSYAVVVNPGQDATWYITNKTSTGFTVVLTPRLAATTLAAGAFDYVVAA
ncbi:hypothetical protein ACO0K2_17820 [Undibacterium sp. MH2W]|uniref:hypothetical protein n=1 Tax=Undibacterium sp. MH2W TaxID=3413044 RepID=UPI003BF2F241